MDGLRKRFEKYKYPLLVLIVGAVLMLLPSGGSTKEQPTPDESLAQLLESVEGVGELSGEGVYEFGQVVHIQGGHLRDGGRRCVQGSGQCEGTDGYY